jgi:quercetin dioxygenase-like cupin family protein
LQVNHEGEEFLYLLEGELELHYSDKIITMAPGDSVYYDSTEPHGYIALGQTQPLAVAVLYSKS